MSSHSRYHQIFHKLWGSNLPVVRNIGQFGKFAESYLRNIGSCTDYINEQNITENSLISVIDMTAGDPIDTDIPVADDDKYIQYNYSTLRNIRDLLLFADNNNVETLYAVRFGDETYPRHSILDDIEFDLVWDEDEVNFEDFDHVYICGRSLGSCVLNRPAGYYDIRNPNKSVILNCSQIAPPVRMPRNHIFSKNSIESWWVNTDNFDELMGLKDRYFSSINVSHCLWVPDLRRVTLNGRRI